MDPFRYAGLPDGATLRNVRQGNVVCGYVFLARVKATLGADIYRSFSLSCSISRGQWKESELQLFPGPSAFGAIEFRWSTGAPRIRLLVIRPMATAVFTVARDRGVTPYVRARESIHKQRSGLYGSRRFTYQPESNTYVCHEGQQLAVSIAEKNFFDPGRKFAPIFRLSS